MARKRKKMALYEVMGKARPKSGYGKTLEQSHPPDEPATEESAEAIQQDAAAQWPKRPKIVQFNAGRIEMSIPYQFAIALLLTVVLLVLVVFRLGQNLSEQKITDSAGKISKSVQSTAGQATAGTKQTPGVVKKISPDAGKVEPAKPKGTNRIVITQYHTRRDLEPVQKYFADNGIETEIEASGRWFFLKTRNAYENPGRAGTDGNAMLKRIVQVGAGYKAPQGYESFAPKLFRDAYGEKIR